MMRLALLSLLGTMATIQQTTAFVSPSTRSTRLASSPLAVVSEPPADTDSIIAGNMEAHAKPLSSSSSTPPFARIMAANRAEIAVRIMRAATELNAGTVAIYVHEDRYSQHRESNEKPPSRFDSGIGRALFSLSVYIS